jgi:aryl-alcohol dehydrogenase-like predicted oxidoreductase
VVERQLGRTPLRLSPIGWGAFKIGRNQGAKYPHGYVLPDQPGVDRLVRGLLELGITYFDTAPAYGSSEERLGAALRPRPAGIVVSTKVGESFAGGRSTYDHSPAAVSASLARSAARLGGGPLDLVLVHSDGRDVEIQRRSGVVGALQAAKATGAVRAIGFSARTVEGADEALAWADAIMVEYNARDRSMEPVIAAAARCGVGVIVKKGLASGHLDPAAAIGFVLANPAVTSLLVGSLSVEHMRRNVRCVPAALAAATEGPIRD